MAVHDDVQSLFSNARMQVLEAQARDRCRSGSRRRTEPPVNDAQPAPKEAIDASI
jgi:hypothetical protein